MSTLSQFEDQFRGPNSSPIWRRLGLIGIFVVAVANFAPTGVAHADGHLKFPIGEGEFSWDSYHAFAKEHDYSGQHLSLATRWTGSGELIKNNMLAYFAEATGATVSHVGSQTFKQDVVVAAEGGTSANITGIQLPGLGADLAKRGFFTPLCSDMADCELADWVRDNYASGQAWVDLPMWEGPGGRSTFSVFITTPT